MTTFPTSFVVAETITHEVWIVREDKEDRRGTAVVVSLKGMTEYDIIEIISRAKIALSEITDEDPDFFIVQERIFRSQNCRLADMIAWQWDKYAEDVIIMYD